MVTYLRFHHFQCEYSVSISDWMLKSAWMRNVASSNHTLTTLLLALLEARNNLYFLFINLWYFIYWGCTLLPQIFKQIINIWYMKNNNYKWNKWKKVCTYQGLVDGIWVILRKRGVHCQGNTVGEYCAQNEVFKRRGRKQLRKIHNWIWKNSTTLYYN